MRILSLRLIVALIVGITAVSLVSSWHQVRTEKDELHLDLDRKGRTIADSLAANAESYLRIGDTAGLKSIVARFSNRDHLLGLGVYDTDFHPLAATPNLHSVVSATPDILRDAIVSDHSKTADTRVHLKRLSASSRNEGTLRRYASANSSVASPNPGHRVSRRRHPKYRALVNCW